MAMSVRTAHGKAFWRCGMEFGAEPTVVPEKKLRERFGPEKAKTCIDDVLAKDRMLVCTPAPEPKEESGQDESQKPEKKK